MDTFDIKQDVTIEVATAEGIVAKSYKAGKYQIDGDEVFLRALVDAQLATFIVVEETPKTKKTDAPAVEVTEEN